MVSDVTTTVLGHHWLRRVSMFAHWWLRVELFQSIASRADGKRWSSPAGLGNEFPLLDQLWFLRKGTPKNSWFLTLQMKINDYLYWMIWGYPEFKKPPYVLCVSKCHRSDFLTVVPSLDSLISSNNKPLLRSQSSQHQHFMFPYRLWQFRSYCDWEAKFPQSHQTI